MYFWRQENLCLPLRMTICGSEQLQVKQFWGTGILNYWWPDLSDHRISNNIWEGSDHVEQCEAHR